METGKSNDENNETPNNTIKPEQPIKPPKPQE